MKEENEKLARLIKQIQNGNQSAFEEFYKLTSPRAYFIALKLTQNEHDAEDILQESYIKVLGKINEIDTSQNITSWLFRIVANKSKDLLRSRNRLVFDGEEESVFADIPEEKAEFCPEESLNQEELRLEVMAAIDELTDEKRACIMMMYFGDMSVREIAKSIEVPESTIKNRLFTARKDLKARFEKSGNVLYGAALGGVLIWALSKTGETTASAFAASAASGTVFVGVNAASSAAATGAATAAVSSSAAATGTGVAAKVAALSVAQKVVAGIAATAVIGGSAAGVATVAKKIESSKEKTTYIEEVTTAPSQTEEYVFAIVTTEESTTDNSSATEKTEPTATVRAESTTKRSSLTSTTGSAQTTKTTAVTSTTKRTTTTRPTTTKPTITQNTTTTRPTTTEYTTEEETTTQPTTTQPATTQPTTTEPTTKALATVSVEVVDMNEEVVANFSFTVEAGTDMTWEYLVSQIKAKGYEPKAGIYGNAVGAIAESGKSYSITAEL